MNPRIFALLLCLLTATPLTALTPERYEQGNIVRMRMTDCVIAQHGFMAAMSGTPVQQTSGLCPEYTLLTDKAVYVIIGKASGDIIPLARSLSFRFERNELAVLCPEARREVRFRLKEMSLRSDWEMAEAARSAWARQHVEAVLSSGGSR
jgi:hypothetical protein